jgi:hypothetical protein
MKTQTFFIKTSLLTALSLFFISCSNTETAPNIENKEVANGIKKLTNPFPFYKKIEIKPGFNFEVLSWGKGVDSLGGYLLLMSDSLKNNYQSNSVARKGIITDAWNMDLDNDGNPELYIELLSKKNVSDLNVYEFSGGSFNKINFPPLSSTLKKAYEGNDKFYTKNGDLFRAVPILNKADSTKTTTEIRTLKYRLSGNSFSSAEEVKANN